MINKNSLKALQTILGNDIVDKLEKSEVYKMGTKTVLSPDEIKIGLQIVPKAILNWLMLHLPHMSEMGNNNLDIPFAEGGRIIFTKFGADNYTGEILKDNKRIYEFKNRSIPGIGLLILTSFELYGMEDMDRLKASIKTPETDEFKEKRERLETIIEQKLMLHRLVEDVVNQKLAQREAIQKLVNERLDQHIQSVNRIKIEEPQEEPEDMVEDKKGKLKKFLENKEKKRQEPVEIEKSEIKCSDCNNRLYKSGGKDEIKLCICYGSDMNKIIKFKKSSDGKVKFNFPKSFDIENIEMLLEDIKGKR